MTNQMKKLVRLSVIYIVIGAIGLIYLGLSSNGKGIPCFFYHNFHIQCFGCGGTRALYYLVHFDFARALSYHPIYTLFLYPFAMLLMIQDYIVCLINAVKKKNIRSLAGFIWGILLGRERSDL